MRSRQKCKFKKSCIPILAVYRVRQRITVNLVDSCLLCTRFRKSQVELREHIDGLATELCRINEDQKVALDLDPYVKKLLNARRRVVLVNNILQNAQERLRRLNHSVTKETARRKAMLEGTGSYPQGSPSK